MSALAHMRTDDPAAADSARRRLLHKSRLPRFPPRRPKSKPHPLPVTDCPTDDTDDIHIDDAHPHPPHDKDLYRWAILYENQRGLTLFSSPFYSPLSLLPSDPQPFTSPHDHNSRASHAKFSLDTYPLPDGAWRWVSTAWMIDMRTDLGEVQHDGFEYNWHFREDHWHAQAGKLGAGALVRRRRWVRLMVRPANRTRGLATCGVNHTTTLPSPSTHRPSLAESDHLAHVWDGSEQDWQYTNRLLKQLGRDGRKLELWQMWLGSRVQTHPFDNNLNLKGKQSDAAPLSSQGTLEQRLSDIVPIGNPPLPTHLITILRNHGKAILHSFVFPESRAQFVDLLRLAGLAQDLEHCLGHAISAADVDFWSYADSMNERLITD